MKKFLEKVPGWAKFTVFLVAVVQILWAGFVVLMSNIYSDWPPLWVWFLPVIGAVLLVGLAHAFNWAADRWL